MPTRRKRANVVLTEEQERVLHGLAATTGQTVSTLVRRAIDAAMPIYSAMLPGAQNSCAEIVTLDFRLLEHVRKLGRDGLLQDDLAQAVEALGEVVDMCDEAPDRPPHTNRGVRSPKPLKTNVVPFARGG